MLLVGLQCSRNEIAGRPWQTSVTLSGRASSGGSALAAILLFRHHSRTIYPSFMARPKKERRSQ